MVFVLLAALLLLFGCVTQNSQNATSNTGQGNPAGPGLGQGDTQGNDGQVAKDLGVGNVFADGNSLLRIASWNLQVFGQKKAGDRNLMGYYARKIGDYDIVVVQEIRDSSGVAFRQLCALLPDYNCVESPRYGRTPSKEQYGFIYKKALLLGTVDHNNSETAAAFERPPFEAKFDYNGLAFSVVTIHVDPDAVNAELDALEWLLAGRSDEIILLGDFNTDCSYYDEIASNDFADWLWAIPDSEDTTVSNGTNCTYDRILVNGRARDHFVDYGVMRDVNAGQSDHYLVWASFKVE